MKETSILRSIRNWAGITEDDTSFDDELIMFINSKLSIIAQLGIGSADGFMVEDENAKWTDIMPDEPKYEKVKEYIHHSVRLAFDPPANSVLIENVKSMIAELEWRIDSDIRMSEHERGEC